MYTRQICVSENQFNTTTSDLAIEEVYTNLDVEPNDPCISTKGFAFRYPQRWLNDPSQNKAIGLRKLSITPQPISLKLYFSYLSPSTDKEIGVQRRSIDVLPENNMLEILTKIRDQLYKRNDNQNTRVYLTWTYVGTKLNLKCYRVDSNTGKELTDVWFKLCGSQWTNDDNVLKLFNQECTDKMRKYINTFHKEVVFDDVWDRGYIEFHSSFSDARKGFLGLNDEFYSKPSLLFKSPYDGPTFYISFYVNDGKASIIPRYCRFIIQLCFILNYKKAIIMENNIWNNQVPPNMAPSPQEGYAQNEVP